jgi:hypothetical protein
LIDVNAAEATVLRQAAVTSVEIYSNLLRTGNNLQCA